jgi:hypothetical protein
LIACGSSETEGSASTSRRGALHHRVGHGRRASRQAAFAVAHNEGVVARVAESAAAAPVNRSTGPPTGPPLPF